MNLAAAASRPLDPLPLDTWLVALTEPVVTIIALLALVVITVATIIAFVKMMLMMARGGTNVQRRALWLEYGRWLVAGLTLQLAGDIVESAIYTTWDSIGQLAAIAVVRTFLNYFLERDIEEIRERQQSPPQEHVPGDGRE
ncbi:DUF1622 domain-containing protein [uncultured Stenotrophomonas sp.]|uniref:DUF1622 domain-containing protein n=1 Tax=uncultured Stenotrophomonas sp. TaxID=165438 RepID=UPI0028E80F5A|nr:DUF1622 domain-containing protein [uncultured Stenotrophomonas sp.]